MKRILLINPKEPPNIFSFILTSTAKITGKKAGFPPVSIASVAALTPHKDDIEITIHDENIHGLIDESYLDNGYDLIGITGLLLHLPRVRAIGNMFRKNRTMVAIGGPGITSSPEGYYDIADVIFLGEAEYAWPAFIRDWLCGEHKRKYRQFQTSAMDVVPTPAWHLLDESMEDYLVGAVQTSRGCTFDCDFCDVVYMFGRGMRHKPIEHVLKEVKMFERYGYQRVLLVDDNIAGGFRYLKELLRELIKLNDSFERPLGFITQISINIAKDDELLQLLADAGFARLLIGVESPNVESLRDVNKAANFKTDMLSDLDKIQSYGLGVQASMMVGFDNDSPRIFDEVFNFIMESNIPQVTLHMVNAPPGTKLWHRLARERRIVMTYGLGNSQTATNIIPKKMTRSELFEGYVSLLKRLYKKENFEKRIEESLKRVKRRPNVNTKPLVLIRRNYKVLLRLLSYFLFSGDKSRRKLILKLIKPTPYFFQKIAGYFLWTIAYKDFQKWIEEPLIDRMAQEYVFPPRVVQLDSYLDLVEKFDYTFIKNVLPGIYGKVFKRSGNIETTSELAVSVLIEFIKQWKDDFEKLEPRHISYLDELCDNTIEKIEKGESINFAEEEYSKESIQKQINKLNLNEKIYKVICEELRGERLLELRNEAAE